MFHGGEHKQRYYIEQYDKPAILCNAPMPKRKKPAETAGFFQLVRKDRAYMPEPWMPFHEASMALTALSGSGT
jgi:hypothetical protein